MPFTSSILTNSRVSGGQSVDPGTWLPRLHTVVQIASMTSVQRFSAFQWEQQIGAGFLRWRRDPGRAAWRLQTMAQAVEYTLKAGADISASIAVMLPKVLSACDDLHFEEYPEVLAYAALHLVDRYARGIQALELILQSGYLPIRKKGVRVLDVGAGPAPSLYAVIDFYSDLVNWGRTTQANPEIKAVTHAHALDLGRAWDPLLHRLSEALLVARSEERSAPLLPFRRRHEGLRGFSVLREHHAERKLRARRLIAEFDEVDDYLPSARANEMAYAEPIEQPSAYDLIVLSNFLTPMNTPQEFSHEVIGLCNSLTPGGLLMIMGATGEKYPNIYSTASEMATAEGLVGVSLPNMPVRAHVTPSDRTTISNHIRANVKTIQTKCPKNEWSAVETELPKDLLDDSQELDFPKYNLIAFRNSRWYRVARYQKASS